MFGLVEVDQRLVEDAAELAIDSGLRSLDALHLAAALVLPQDDLHFATWDRRLHTAAMTKGLQPSPIRLIEKVRPYTTGGPFSAKAFSTNSSCSAGLTLRVGGGPCQRAHRSVAVAPRC